MSVYDVPAAEYNNKLAEALKELEEFKMPEWAAYVKTSVARERPPKEEFWHKRAASILRQLYIHGIVGVGRLRTRYGGRKNRGKKPERFRKGSGKIIRVILQQAETAGFVEKMKDRRAGRQLTEKGREFLDSINNLSSLAQENQRFSAPQKHKFSEEKKTSLTKEETKLEVKQETPVKQMIEEKNPKIKQEEKRE